MYIIRLILPQACVSLQIPILPSVGSTIRILLYKRPNPRPGSHCTFTTCYCFCSNPTHTKLCSHKDPVFTTHYFCQSPTHTNLFSRSGFAISCFYPLIGKFCLDPTSYGGLRTPDPMLRTMISLLLCLAQGLTNLFINGQFGCRLNFF